MSKSTISYIRKKALVLFILTILFMVPFYTVFAQTNTKIVIDPGHGGIDSGAKFEDVIEKNITLDISKKLKTFLSETGYKVTMTRDTDILLNSLSKVGNTIELRDLNARVALINNSSANLFVSIHVNSVPDYPKASGSIVYYNPNKPQSKKLASYIQKELNNITVNNKKRVSNTISESNFYILKNSKIDGVLIETAFISNKQERDLLKGDDFKTKIAKAIEIGIQGYVASVKPNKPKTNKFNAIIYKKDGSYTESMTFTNTEQGYSWIKNKGQNGIIYTGTGLHNVIGVVLENYVIDFTSDYIISMNKYKNKYDKKIMVLQHILSSLGYKIDADGYYGLKTYNAILDFQKKNHLATVDGIVGKETYEKLASEFKII